MTKQLSPAERLKEDLSHLSQEMTRLAYTTHPAGSAELQYARQEFRELEATYHTKVQQLAGLGYSPAALANLTDLVARAAERLDWNATRPALRPAPSAAGGARYVTDLLVLNMMVPGFYKALTEWGGCVVKEWEPQYGGPDTTMFTVSLDCVNELFELGAYMVLNHYQGKMEGGYRG